MFRPVPPMAVAPRFTSSSSSRQRLGLDLLAQVTAKAWELLAQVMGGVLQLGAAIFQDALELLWP